MTANRSKNVPLMAAMARAGITGQDLAQSCGVHRVTISAILNKRVEPKPQTISRIARALQAAPEEIGLSRGSGRHDD